ncbi:uncharacterized protein [Clytia hemisphaerica]|uniref:Uncharacterized protein n=1 Tax=Clytia hemisphaerica TaxID=252671 RepID=A0A7M5UYW5_9CNID|eukprot:TCONS_00002242-protein
MQKILFVTFLSVLVIQYVTCYKATTLSPQKPTPTIEITAPKQISDTDEIDTEDEDMELIKGRVKRGFRIRRRRRSDPCPGKCAGFLQCMKYTANFWRCIEVYPTGNCRC